MARKRTTPVYLQKGTIKDILIELENSTPVEELKKEFIKYRDELIQLMERNEKGLNRDIKNFLSANNDGYRLYITDYLRARARARARAKSSIENIENEYEKLFGEKMPTA